MSLRERLARRLAQMDGAIAPRPPGAPVDVALDAVLPGGGEWRIDGSACWTLRIDLGDCWPDAGAFAERIRPTLAGPPCADLRGWPDRWRAPRIAAVDIETCGFASMPVFMVGVLAIDESGAVLHQGFARDYGEEPALLEWTARTLDGAGAMLTFNGRSFDIPYLRDRRIYHRLAPLDEPPHLDVLHAARRAWRGTVPDCRLTTLERCIMGRVRVDDVAGREVPDLYHAYVRTGDARAIRSILLHNRRDLVALAELFAELWHSHHTATDG